MREMNSNPTNGGTEIGRQMESLRSVFSIVRELGSQAAPTVSTGAELLRVASNMVPGVIDGIREWRIGKEAERDTAVLMTQPQQRPTGPQPVPPRPAPAIPLPPVPPPQPPIAAQSGNGAPSTEFIESRIIELVLDVSMPADEAASRTLEFLNMLSGENAPLDRNYALQLATLGETELINLFNMRPILKPATGNMIRLAEFIRSFLKYHAEDLAEDTKAVEETKGKPN
jgi:hypothetical protein